MIDALYITSENLVPFEHFYREQDNVIDFSLSCSIFNAKNPFNISLKCVNVERIFYFISGAYVHRYF